MTPLLSPKELIRSAAAALEESEVPRPRWTAEQLLARRLGCLPVELYLKEFDLPSGEELRFRAEVSARAQGMPLQYLMGIADFYGREFRVGPGVFIPRPETEILVEAMLAFLPVHPELSRRRNGALKGTAPFVVDVGTGSGAIAVTLALERPDLRVAAIERSEPALAFARENIRRHAAPVRMLQGELVEPLADQSVDWLAANPPYLDPAAAGDWPREIGWEPWMALDGKEGGLSFIGALIGQAGRVLKPQGRLILEIGMGQAGPVRRLAAGQGMRVEEVVPDLAGIERILILRRRA